MLMEGGPYSIGRSRHAGQTHLTGHVVGWVVGGPEYFGLAEVMPSGAELVNQARAESVCPIAFHALRAPRLLRVSCPQYGMPAS